jgi:hypothetical protein
MPVTIPGSIRGQTRTILIRLVENLPTDKIAQLGNDVDAYRRTLEEHCHEHPKMNLKLVEALAAVCHRLLTCYPGFSPEQRALVVGAVRYFVAEQDANNDADDLFGFDDDLAVLNAVSIAVGHEEFVVTQPLR